MRHEAINPKESENPKWAVHKPLNRIGWTINNKNYTAGYTVTAHGNVRVFSKVDGVRREDIIQPYDFAEIIHEYLIKNKG